jgi:2-haloacid dehalogenase
MNGIKALTFDTGGTVLDWHTGITRALELTGQRYGLERDWPAIANEYRHRSLGRMVGSVSPGFNIDDVHRDVLDDLVKEHSLSALTREDRVEIVRAWHTLRAWSDFGPALNRLRIAYPVVSFTILSTALVIDVSRVNGITWDCLICCEMLDVYKTQPQAYQRAAKLLQLRSDELLMVACHNFDLLAARREGYRTAFVRRPQEWGDAGPPDPIPDPSIDLVVDDFPALAAALGT